MGRVSLAQVQGCCRYIASDKGGRRFGRLSGAVRRNPEPHPPEIGAALEGGKYAAAASKIFFDDSKHSFFELFFYFPFQLFFSESEYGLQNLSCYNELV